MPDIDSNYFYQINNLFVPNKVLRFYQGRVKLMLPAARFIGVPTELWAFQAAGDNFKIACSVNGLTSWLRWTDGGGLEFSSYDYSIWSVVDSASVGYPAAKFVGFRTSRIRSLTPDLDGMAMGFINTGSQLYEACVPANQWTVYWQITKTGIKIS